MESTTQTAELGNQESIDWMSIPVKSYVDAGEHGLFFKLTDDTFVRVKIDSNGQAIGNGTSINIGELPKVNLQELQHDEIANIPQRHGLPSLGSEFRGIVCNMVGNLIQKARNCLTRK